MFCINGRHNIKSYSPLHMMRIILIIYFMTMSGVTWIIQSNVAPTLDGKPVRTKGHKACMYNIKLRASEINIIEQYKNLGIVQNSALD